MSGLNLLVWLAPVTGVVAGDVVLRLVIRRWARGRQGPSPGPAAPAPDGGEKYESQLENELKDFREKGFK